MLLRLLLSALLALILSGCWASNTTTTKYWYTDSEGVTRRFEGPKDFEAENLEVIRKDGTRIRAKKIKITGNVDQTKADAARIRAQGELLEKGFEGAAEGAVKGIKGF
jgi:hypothetical protein